ncbi:MAG: patatin-like phospholipase family protein [Bacteroidales bacterium]|nr:patatin-like phospholipase family protein [Bacteroidales bacterium]MCF8455239.1 patatin-like phospholipase family protein [Bacteroidales bacterium]
MKTSTQIVILILLINLMPYLVFEGFSQENKRPKIGLVLSGGGAKGFAHLGAIKVLEEAGIQVDVISGTSIGSIVGGFYAMGYPVEFIDSLVRHANWQYLLTDEINRNDMALYEKEIQDLYFFQLPFSEGKFSLPGGLIAGRNLLNFFTRYSFPVHNQEDFTQFPRPFACIAADAITGEVVVLDHGYFPDAIRASMSIPTLFDPVEMDGHLLVDGGLINNFPVQEAINLGADIIIGIDVQNPTFSTKDEILANPTRILTQAGNILRQPLFDKNLRLCDYYIRPDIAGFSSSSFQDVDTLIKRGEDAARKMLPVFKQLAESLNRISPPVISPKTKYPVDSILINHVIISGLNELEIEQFLSIIEVEEGHSYLIADISHKIDRAYQHILYQKIDYRLQENTEGEGYELIVKVLQNSTHGFNLGLHFDNYFNASVRMNVVYRNVTRRNGRLSFSGELGENHYFKAEYLKDNGYKPGLYGSLGYDRREWLLYNGKDVTTSLYTTRFCANLGVTAFFRGNGMFRVGFTPEFVNRKRNIGFDLLSDPNKQYYSYYGQFLVDTYTEGYYPRKGNRVFGSAKIITDNFYELEGGEPILQLILRYNTVIPINKKWNAGYGLYAGEILGTNPEAGYLNFSMGGFWDEYTSTNFPFFGLALMQETGYSLLATRLDLNYYPSFNNVIFLRTNVGKADSNFENIFNGDDYIGGLGLGYGYKSIFGPLEALITFSEENGLGFVLNLGYTL